MPRTGGNLGQYLLAQGIITIGQLAIALREQQARRTTTLGAILVERDFATRAQIDRAELNHAGGRSVTRSPKDGQHAC